MRLDLALTSYFQPFFIGSLNIPEELKAIMANPVVATRLALLWFFSVCRERVKRGRKDPKIAVPKNGLDFLYIYLQAKTYNTLEIVAESGFQN